MAYIISTDKVLQKLKDRLVLAHDELDNATRAITATQNDLNNLQDFILSLRPYGEMQVVRSGCVETLVYRYEIEDGQFMVTILHLDNGPVYSGMILDPFLEVVLFGCSFFLEEKDDHQMLFDRVITEYAEFKFNL